VAYVVEDVQEPPAVAPQVRVGRDVALNERELLSLRRGAEAPAVEQLDALLADYAEVKKGLRGAVDGGEAAVARVRPPVVLDDAALRTLRKGAGQMAVRKLGRLLEDYQAARAALVRLREAATGGSAPRVLVRIDQAGVNQAPEVARQRVHLTFRSDTDKPVSVQGRTLDSLA
jgi:hypothetical protein